MLPQVDTDTILSSLNEWDPESAQAAARKAAAAREEITPRLLEVLASAADHPEKFYLDEGQTVHIQAMLLLAQFREPGAFPLLLRIFSAPAETAERVAGQFTEGFLGRALGSVCGGDLGALAQLAENAQADEFVREAAVEAALTAIAAGSATREQAIAYFGRLFGSLEREPSIVWDTLVASASDLCARELENDVRRAYQDELVDSGYVSWTEVVADMRSGQSSCVRLEKSHPPIVDTGEEIAAWLDLELAEEGAEEDSLYNYDGLAPDPDDPDAGFIPAPYQREQPKVGRNQPCPCGSGKKYKKCCGA